MNNPNLAKAAQIIDQSRQEKLKKIQAILADLPDDFDWAELNKILATQNK